MKSKEFISLFKKCILGGALGVSALSAMNASAAKVDLLVVYDDYSSQQLNGQVDTAMRSWVSQANEIYKNSQIDIQLNLAGTMRYNAPGADMGAVLGHIRVNNSINQKRDEVGADFVTQLSSTGACGLGYVAVSKDWAYNVVGPHCGAQVLAHELGHNMGLNHSRKQGNTGGARFAYALGHGVDGSFATTMAYPGEFHTNWLPTFSNPRTSCNGMPCGVNEGQAQQADAAKALNNVKNEIADFKATKKEVTYQIRAKHSGKCLDAAGWGKSNGTNILQWNCHGGSNQRFRIIDAGNGYWALQNINSGKCLEVGGWSQDSGGNVQLWECHLGDNQKVKPAQVAPNVYQFGFKHSGICLDVQTPNLGSQVYQWSCHGNDNQRFYLDAL